MSLVTAGFHGVQLNIEPTPDGDAGFLLLIDAVQGRLPEGAFPGVATNLMRPRLLTHRLMFSESYLRQIARRVDQVAVMNYDTYMPTPALYQRMSAFQTRTVLRTVASVTPNCDVLIGVPTYPSEGGLRQTV